MQKTRIRGLLTPLFAALLVIPLTLLAAPASAATPGVTVVYTEGSRWETGYSGQFTISNGSDSPLSDWTIKVELPEGAGISSLWSAQWQESGSGYTLTPPSWGAPIPAGGSYTIGFNGSFSGGETVPVSCTVNGGPCSGSGGTDDTEPPSVPAGVTAGEVSSSTAHLSWDTSTDNVGVAGYEILDGDTVVRGIVGDTTSATVSGLSADTEYTLTVRAYDAAGNRSAASEAVTVRTEPTGGGDDGTPSEPGNLRVGYFTQWGIYERGYLVNDMVTSGSAEKMTHINYAFANISPEGTCFEANQLGKGDAWADYGKSFSDAESVDGEGDTWDQDLKGNFNQLRELKQMYPDLKVYMSIGGWTWSQHLSDAALTEQSRERMVSSCVDMFLRGNLPVFSGAGGPGAAYGVFDGFDLDWEWPASEGHPHNTVRPEDKENYTALVEEFRQQLDALERETDRDYGLSAFLPADPEKVEAGFEVSELMPNFDHVTVQGYDFHGGWDQVTNHQSNLTPVEGDPGPDRYSSKQAIEAYIERGADPSKLLLGVPFYSRGWTGVQPGPDGNGLFQSAAGPAPGPFEAGIDDYKNIKELTDTYTLYRDDEAGTAWLYDGNTFWTYDDPVAMEQKTQWAIENDLGGIMMWSLDGDDAQGSLISAVDRTLDSA